MKQTNSTTQSYALRRRPALLNGQGRAPQSEQPEDGPLQPALRQRPGAELMKNLAVSAALVLCAVTLRAGAIPSLQGPVDAVLTAITGDMLLDDRLGKLSFVSAMFPESVLVFGGQQEGLLAMPVMSGSLVHAWSREEPYAAWSAQDGQVYAAVSGEVVGVYHGMEEELLVQIRAEGGLSCVHGNLEQACVHTGDQVSRGQPIGTLLEGQPLSLEVRQNGLSIDPALLLPGVS